jgi:uncharacterized protein
VGPWPVEPASLNRHTFVTGATGSGKSQTVRALLAHAGRAGLPWLVVEPAKAEYRLMAHRLGADRVIAIRPGDPAGVPAGLNPLEPEPGFPLQTHLDLVRALFVAAFQSDEPFPQVMAAALTRSYTDLGWDLVIGEPAEPRHAPRYPTLADLQRVAERVVADIGYGREVTDNVLGFIRVRLSSLRLGTAGRFLDGGHPIDVAALVRHSVVLEIEDVGDDRDKAFLMGIVLIRLVEHLRVRERRSPAAGPGLRHLTVFEEAHRLLRRVSTGPAAHALELFASLLAEVRAYGEGLVIADQIPSKLLPDVIKNTAVKVVHRLPALDDRQAVGATMNLTEAQSRHLVALPPGTAAAFSDGMDGPLLVRMPDGTALERGGPVPRLRPESDVVGRRSGTCGPDCRDVPCTLRDMRAAERLAGAQPWWCAWAELTVLAHLAGFPVPVPRSDLLERARATPDRLRDCALGQAVDAAVAVRTAVVWPVMSPPALAVHVTGALRSVVAERRPCPAEEPEWLAPPWRWALVLDELAAAGPDDAPHPRTREWEITYGRRIPGATRAAQRDAVRAWSVAAAGEDAWLGAAFGSAVPSALERATGATRDDEDWPDRLADLLDGFPGCQWPLAYLTVSDDTVSDDETEG